MYLTHFTIFVLFTLRENLVNSLCLESSLGEEELVREKFVRKAGNLRGTCVKGSYFMRNLTDNMYF